MLDVNRPTWDELYFSIADLVSKRSKDPRTKVGAVIVKDNCVIGIGYNGQARKSQLAFNWNTAEKYDYIIHAEMNAISNACRIGVSCVGAEVYVTHSPCHHCVNMLIQHGISKVYFKTKYKDFDLSETIANSAGLKLIQVL